MRVTAMLRAQLPSVIGGALMIGCGVLGQYEQEPSGGSGSSQLGAGGTISGASGVGAAGGIIGTGGAPTGGVSGSGATGGAQIGGTTGASAGTSGSASGAGGCSSSLDSDGDGMDDCTELNDGDPWTDKDIFNGMRVREANQCSLLGLCSDNDTLAKVNACMNTTIEQQKDQYSGWDWNDSPDSICSSGYNFQANWTVCDSTWQADWQGFINLTSAGQHCFQISGSNIGGCASLFFNTETTGIQTGQAATCFNVPAGVYPIRWHYTMVAGSTSSMEVLYCFGGGSTCTPSAALPARMLRVTYP